MNNVRLAEIGPDNVCLGVVETPAGTGPEYATEFLGLTGVFVVDEFGEAGPGALFDQATGRFSPPDMPVEEPTE